MHSYNSLEDVIKLSLKVEALNKYRSSTIVRSVAKEDLPSKNPSDAKTTPKPQVKSKVHKPHLESTPKMCYKCQGLGQIASECPNQKVVTLIEEYEAKEEDVEQVVKSNHVQEDEEKSSTLSKFELDVEEIVESNHIQEDEEKSLLQSKSELEIKDSSYVMALVEETENEMEMP